MAALKFLSQDWPAISLRLEQGLLLEPAQRPAWIAALDEPAAIKHKLALLLLGAAAVETDDFLNDLPRMALGPHEATRSGPDDAAPGMAVGPYRLIRELGVGGMGLVWLAERVDGGLKRAVALKLPRLNWSPGLAERMRRERDILVSLDHPNIARIHDAGVDDAGRPYLALEYVQGEAIHLHCQGLALPVRERVQRVLQLVLQVARAVAHAHSRLVVHRDLKPANILVTPQGQVSLLDFGIAKLLESEPGSNPVAASALTLQAGRALTLDYASPEQIRGDPIGTATDVYSLGVVTFELLAQAKPYTLARQSAAALEEAITSTDVRQASSVAAGAELRRALKGDLDAILNKALKKSVAERYPTIEAFALDIERHLAKLPVLARPDSRSYRLGKFVGRNRRALGGAAAITLALLAGTGVATWKAIEANAQRARAERVKDMVAAIFASANPYAAGKAEVSVRDLLKAGVDRVQRDLTQEPAVAAELLSLISTSYRDLGEVDPALATARTADTLASQAYPAGHAMRAQLQRVLAQALSDKGEGAEAQRLLEQAIAAQRALGPAGAVELARSLGFMSHLLVDEGRVEESITMARDAVDLLLSQRGDKDTLTIDAIGELSSKLMIGRQAKEALAEAERAHRLAVAAFADPAHPTTISQLAHLAQALQANGQYSAAAVRWRGVLAAHKKAFNPRGPQVANSLLGLAVALEAQGDLLPALAAYEESLAMMQGWGAGNSGELAIRHYSIGRVALFARQPEKALLALDKAIAVGTAIYGTRGGRVRDAQNFRATALVYAGRFQEAQAVLGQHMAQDRQNQSPTLRAALRISALLDHARNDGAAVALAKIDEARAIEAKLTSLPRKALAQTQAERGRAQINAQQSDAAAESLTQAVATLREEEALPTPFQADAWVALGRARLAQERWREALEPLAMADRFWQQFDAANAFAGEAAFWHGMALLKTADPAAARAQFARAAPVLGASTWPLHRAWALRAREQLR